MRVPMARLAASIPASSAAATGFIPPMRIMPILLGCTGTSHTGALVFPIRRSAPNPAALSSLTTFSVNCRHTAGISRKLARILPFPCLAACPTSVIFPLMKTSDGSSDDPA